MPSTPDTPRPPTGPGDVVVGYDGSAAARRAVDWAVDRALEGATAAGRRLVVATVVDPRATGLSERLPTTRRVLMAAGHRDADDAAAHVRRTAPTLPVRTDVRLGRPWRVLLEYAADASLTVLGLRHRLLLTRLLTGSTSHPLLRATFAPVALVPDLDVPPDLGRCGTERVVALVGPEGGRAAVAFAAHEAAARHRELTVVRAVRDGRTSDLLDHRLAPSDLLVVGEHVPGDRPLLLDRVVEAVLRRPACPVVVVPEAAADRATASRP